MSAIDNVTGLKLDITSGADRAKVPPLNIDVLMNNAGVGFSGSLAEVDVDLCRKNSKCSSWMRSFYRARSATTNNSACVPCAHDTR